MAGTISKRKGHPIRLATWSIEFQNICQYQLMCETLKPRNQWIVILRVITSHSQPIFIGQLYPGYRLVLHRICPRPGPNIPTPFPATSGWPRVLQEWCGICLRCIDQFLAVGLVAQQPCHELFVVQAWLLGKQIRLSSFPMDFQWMPDLCDNPIQRLNNNVHSKQTCLAHFSTVSIHFRVAYMNIWAISTERWDYLHALQPWCYDSEPARVSLPRNLPV